MIERFRVGVISSIHGIKGEAKIYPTTQDMTRFKKLKSVYATIAGMEQILEIESVKFIKQMVILKFKGIDTPEEMAKLKNTDLYVDRAHATPLKERENYIADLIGLRVISDGDMELGEVIDVFPTGANHVMEVKMKEKNILIPYISQCILDVDLEKSIVKVHILEGLLDL